MEALKYGLDIQYLKDEYQSSSYRDDEKVIALDHIDFVAFVWQLQTGHFDIVPFSRKSFLRYFATGTKSCIDILEAITPDNRVEIQSLILS